jgi:hypothetical protein
MAPFIQILSVFLQLQSWLCIGMFCKRTIFCVNYMRIHVLDVSDYSDNESDIPTTSSHIQLRSSTGPLTPQFPQLFFSHTMSRNHSESIWQAWHFSDNSQQTQDSGRLFKIWLVYEHFVQKFKSVYKTRNVAWWIHDPIAGSPEIYAVQSRKNNKTWSAGENGVWDGIGLYLQYGDMFRWGKVVGEHSASAFRQKLGTKSSHLWRQFL